MTLPDGATMTWIKRTTHERWLRFARRSVRGEGVLRSLRKSLRTGSGCLFVAAPIGTTILSRIGFDLTVPLARK